MFTENWEWVSFKLKLLWKICWKCCWLQYLYLVMFDRTNDSKTFASSTLINETDSKDNKIERNWNRHQTESNNSFQLCLNVLNNFKIKTIYHHCCIGWWAWCIDMNCNMEQANKARPASSNISNWNFLFWSDSSLCCDKWCQPWISLLAISPNLIQHIYEWPELSPTTSSRFNMRILINGSGPFFWPDHHVRKLQKVSIMDFM